MPRQQPPRATAALVPEIARVFLGPGDRHGPADHPREGEDQGGEDPLSGAVRSGPPGPGHRVLAVLYLIFNEGYLASDPEKEAVRSHLTAEAIRLTRLVRDRALHASIVC
jgi:RNA polymerase sigma-70 factor (ECF subfamily)